MRLLLTNDDGIYAPGLAAMEQQLRGLGDLTVAAPATEQSGVGHAITFLSPLTAKEVFEGDRTRGWAVDGSPADSVKLGISALCGERPSLVVSGINSGLNAGINVLYSGTVAAAIEGAFFGITSIAVSLEWNEHFNFARAAEMLQEDNVSSIPDIRTGIGYDVHRFGDGDHVILCGVRVPHGRGLQGHSDADVGMHTITDAIYGALARGDIGQHFPPSDPQWKGAASEVFLKHACALAREMGFVVTHVDVTLVCEHPKIGPHVPAMRAEMARLMGLDIDRVSVKATTSERLGFTGREEGIAAVGTATLVKA